MLDQIMERTNQYIEAMPKKERKKYGQFFTSMETAIYMAGLFIIPEDKETLSVLDAGAGSGILSCALIEMIQNNSKVKKIKITCYENDSNILELLNDNLSYMKHNAKIEIDYEINMENYITSQYLEFNEKFGGNINARKYDVY